MDNKTVGIGADNYKIEKFKTALIAAGFTELDITPFVGNTSLISVKNVPIERVHDIHKICIKLQVDFNPSN